jgi:hypothetical protein
MKKGNPLRNTSIKCVTETYFRDQFNQTQTSMKKKMVLSSNWIIVDNNNCNLGGVGKIISIGFTSKSYKSCKKMLKKKTPEQIYEKTVELRQDRYSSTGNAWKVWDSAIVLGRWIYKYRSKFENQKVHEIGAGCGLVRITFSVFIDSYF